ncbi:MAG TPA: condensation domain-containing protein, partial [Longimicrobiaceae bacterium]|nr:condensation domain-containing protein [Longimicrobiaceae bacterium]
YTSGSTGTPKGVRVTHRSLLATLHAAREAFPFDEGDRVLSLASFAFDIWLFEAVLPLLAGASVRVLSREEVLDPERLLAEMAEATAVHAVPALMRQVVQALGASGRVLPRVRRAFVGGDAVAPELTDEMRAVFPAASVHVLYGPTEATVICAAHAAREGGPRRRWIGRPLGNAALYVLDGGLLPAPVGVPGELCIGGVSVARDYLGRPELTAERFVPDALSGEPGARLFRSGDRARWTAGGELEFLGRLDAQVKIRGFRVEPGEVEAVLAAHPRVAAAAVVVREDAPGDARLAAYAVPAPGEAVDAAGLERWLAERLPAHMLPSRVLLLERLPLTPTGKLDRRALPAPADSGRADAYVPPRTPVEATLAAAFADVLGAERVGVHDGFFALGGHSLLAMRVVSRVREALGVEVPVRALFEQPTAAGLAQRVEEALRAGGTGAAPIPRRADGGPAPLSFAQQRLWFIHQLDPASAAYNMPSPLRLRGPLRPGALRRALSGVVRRHEALRTVFEVRDGGTVQVVCPAAPVPFPVVDLSGLSGGRMEAEAARLAEREALRPFDLARGPLLRAALLRLGEDDHAALFTLHHVASDGWSMDVLVRELTALYAGAPLPELPIQYADYAVWQRERLAGAPLETQLRYWRERLAGAPPHLEIATDRPRPALPGSQGAHRPLALSPQTTRRLREVGAREGATLFMTLLAAWQLLLARYGGQDDVVVGTPIAGRTRAELEPLIGFFVNTLVLR